MRAWNNRGVCRSSGRYSLNAMPAPLTLADFDFALPTELIAQHPAPERSASRLLDGRGAVPRDRIFRDLPSLLDPGDLLVFNDTRVIKARLFGRKGSGGAVEALVERIGEQCEVLAQLRASKSPRPGTVIRFAETFDAEVLGRAGPEQSLYRLRFPSDPFALLASHGHVPLPPYITHADDADDERRYQTIFASRPGAVAAPTAALHFDEAVLVALEARGIARAQVTLHVGAGTFQPVRTERIEDHRMHSEWCELGEDTVAAIAEARSRGSRVVAVGTTTVRTLESASRAAIAAGRGDIAPWCGETDIFITPGFEFRIVDAMVTNFHLPKSTLMMLVCAFAGHAHVMALYRHAVEARYRFFSYGDAMILSRAMATAAPR
jgi:S-adenosylmethionine:tRNA ribosyltransferase-isomerase